MKLKCAYSGLTLDVSYIPGVLPRRVCCHPIFFCELDELMSLVERWGNAELTSDDSYLLFLALLNQTELVEFRTSAMPEHRERDSIVAAQMESLLHTLFKLQCFANSPKFQPPHAVIANDTASLNSVADWLRAWRDYCFAYDNNLLEEAELQRLKRREERLQAYIKDANKPVAHYAKHLADWAAVVAQFPEGVTPINGQMLPLCEYWKSIIIRCCKTEQIFEIPAADLIELIEHCEDNIPHGTIYAATLMELLRAGRKRQQNYLGLGNADLSAATYQILSPENTKEDAAKLAIIQSAPTVLPVPGAYPNKLAYLRAKSAWDMKLSYEAQLALDAATAVIHSDASSAETIKLPDGKEI